MICIVVEQLEILINSESTLEGIIMLHCYFNGVCPRNFIHWGLIMVSWVQVDKQLPFWNWNDVKRDKPCHRLNYLDSGERRLMNITHNI